MTIDELKIEPFSFKAGHLRKIAMSREQKAAAAAAESQAPVQNIDHETASAASGSTRSRTSAAPARTAFLPTAPKTKQLLPNGKHAFLSYQWDVQEQVKEIKGMLNEKQIKCTDAIINRGLSSPSLRMTLMVYAVLQIKRGANYHTSVLSWHRTLVLYTLC